MFIISQFLWAQLSQVFCKTAIKMSPRAWFLSGGLTGNGMTPEFTQVVGKIHFLVAVKLRGWVFAGYQPRPPSAPEGRLEFLVMWLFP